MVNKGKQKEKTGVAGSGDVSGLGDFFSDPSSGDKFEETVSKVVEKVNTNLTDVVGRCLNQALVQLSTSLNQSFEKLTTAIVDRGEPPTKSDKSDASGTEKGYLSDKMDKGGGCNSGVQVVDYRGYISVWKDLGGMNLFFSPNGAMHPVHFIKKLSDMFVEAGVPDDKKIFFAVNCLRGSAQDWAEIKEFVDFDTFNSQFLRRYWSVEHERETLCKVKYGVYEGGSRADYFLRIVKEAGYLSQPFNDKELINLVINHFPLDVKRGILNSGFNTVDQVEEHLRKIDGTYETSTNTSANSNAGSWNRFRRRDDREGQNNAVSNVVRGTNRPTVRHESERDNLRPSNEARNQVNTIFNDGGEDLLEEPDTEEKKSVVVAPAVSLFVEGCQKDALVDSGSQVTRVSDVFLKKMLGENPKLPIIPARGATLTGAWGNK